MVRTCWRGDPRARAGLTRLEWVVVAVVLLAGCIVWLPYFLSSVDGPMRINGCANNLSSFGKAIQVHQTTSGGAWPVASTERLAFV